MAKNDYWFKPKKYGWGWGLPQNRKGWLAFGIFTAVWLAALAWLSNTTTQESPSSSTMALFIAIILVDCAALVYVSLKHGEPPKWRWGTKHGRTKS